MIWSFAEFEVDLTLCQLRRGGEAIKMEPKVFDVLTLLLRHRDRVLSKDELLCAVWPGEALSVSVLPRCVAAVRRAVGDDRARQSVVKTVHGRGYRFVADVREVAAPPTESERSARTASGRFVGREGAMAFLSREYKVIGLFVFTVMILLFL